MVSLPSFFSSTKSHFGLSIGRTSLRAVQINTAGQIGSFAEVYLPDDTYKDGVLVKKDIFVAALKKLLEMGKFTTPYTAICFSEAYAYSREYTVPKISTTEVNEAVSWHVNELFPFPEAELYFDWKILHTEEKELRIVVVATLKKVIDPLVEVLVSIGLKPLSIEPGSAVIGRLLRLKNTQQALVTEINRKGAYVTLVEGEKGLFTTVINYTPQDTSQTYFQNINQTILEMVRFYKNKGVLKEEILQIILTGELASEKSAQEIAKVVKYPLKILTTPLQNPAFNKAFAIATSSIARPADPQTINLLPSTIQQLYDQERETLFYKTLFIRTSVVVGVITLFSLVDFLAIDIRRQNLEKQIQVLTNTVKPEQKGTQSLLLLNAQAKDIVTLATLRKTPQDKLLVLKSILDQQIKVDQLDYDDSKLIFTLSGVAKNRSDLLSLKNKLEQTTEFANVTIPLGSLESPENVHFTITFVSKK